MDRPKDKWRRVTKAEPCPVCEHPDFCRIGVRFVHCQRVESAKPGKTSGWYHPLDATTVPVPQKLSTRPEPKTDEELDECFRRELQRSKAELLALAALLGVSADSLRRLGVGWNGMCWTIPERSPAGLITGVSYRAPDGSKRMSIGSRRGLVFPRDLFDGEDGPVLVVEGMTDTAAALTIGIPAVGRQNNSGGGELLAVLLEGWQGRVIVMGENDWREPKQIHGHPHSPDCNGCQRCFPGKYGCEVVAGVLRKAFRWPPVGIRMPPDGAKDLRAWVNGIVRDPENVVACAKVGESLLRRFGAYRRRRHDKAVETSAQPVGARASRQPGEGPPASPPAQRSA